VFYEDSNSRHIMVKLAEDEEDLLKQTIPDGNVGNIKSIIVGKRVHIVHHVTVVDLLNDSEDEQILQVAITRELSTLSNEVLE
jgi:hypothetical protein